MSTTLSMILSIVCLLVGIIPRMTKRYKEWKAEASADSGERGQKACHEEDVKKANEMIQRLDDCGLYDKAFCRRQVSGRVQRGP